MDMEAYRRWNNMQPGARYLAKQPKTIGGDRDLVFPSDDARRRFSFISRTNYGEEAEILILNNLRVGHSRLPGRRFSVSGFQRPLYQCSFNIGLQGNIPVIDYLDDALDYKKEPLWNPLQQIFYRLSQAVRNPFE
jgi:hypothetical protein